MGDFLSEADMTNLCHGLDEIDWGVQQVLVN
jgi:hypothetical protein